MFCEDMLAFNRHCIAVKGKVPNQAPGITLPAGYNVENNVIYTFSRLIIIQQKTM